MSYLRRRAWAGHALVIVLLAACGKTDPPAAPVLSASQRKEQYLASLPIGMEVTHSPDPVKATPITGGKWKYKYIYKTSVQSTVGPLTIVEFDAFGLVDGKWQLGNFSGKPFGPAEFASWYACPDAVLEPGKSYADTNNWTASNVPEEGTTRWFYIAVDADGKHYKGEAIAHQIAEIGP
jgi:hypothetical protein